VFLVKRRFSLGGFAHRTILDFEDCDASMHQTSRVATLKTQTAPFTLPEV
jgi:hypothetical protein